MQMSVAARPLSLAARPSPQLSEACFQSEVERLAAEADLTPGIWLVQMTNRTTPVERIGIRVPQPLVICRSTEHLCKLDAELMLRGFRDKQCVPAKGS